MNENRSHELPPVAFLVLPSVQGPLSILFGVSALLFLLLPQVSMVLVFAVYALLEAALAFLRSYRVADWHGGRWLLLSEGCLNLVIASLVFAFPPFWSIALPWLIAAWAMMTGALHLAGSVRSRARKNEWWIPIWAGVIRLAYGVLAWFLPVSLPSVGKMSGHAVVFLLLTATMAILFGAVMLVWGFSPHRGSMAPAT